MKYVVEVNSVSDDNVGLDYTIEATTAEAARAKVVDQLPAGDWYIEDIHEAA